MVAVAVADSVRSACVGAVYPDVLRVPRPVVIVVRGYGEDNLREPMRFKFHDAGLMSAFSSMLHVGS